MATWRVGVERPSQPRADADVCPPAVCYSVSESRWAGDPKAVVKEQILKKRRGRCSKRNAMGVARRFILWDGLKGG